MMAVAKMVRKTRVGEHPWPVVVKIAGTSPVYLTVEEARTLRDQLTDALA